MKSKISWAKQKYAEPKNRGARRNALITQGLKSNTTRGRQSGRGLNKQREYYLKVLLSQSDEPDERRKILKQKQNIFKGIIRDIAHKYEHMNKKLLISFKKSFVGVGSTHDVIKKIRLESGKIK